MEPEKEKDTGDDRPEHLATGIAIGISLGVALSVATDNWGMLGAGLALGIGIGVAMSGDQKDDSGDEHPTD